MYKKNYRDLKNVDGTYSIYNFFRRIFQLIDIKRFLSCAFIDSIWCLFRYGAIYDDYFEYRFIEKTHYSRREYVTKGKSRRIQKMLNKSGSAECMYNKIVFNREYSKFRTLNDYEFSSTSTKESFLSFVKKCNRHIIAKPFLGSSGYGIYIPDVSTDEQALQVYDLLSRDGNYFCEEFFVQTGILHEINPSSVNTVRIYTVNDGEEIHIMGTYIRFGGKDSFVDNIHSGGMSCVVDIDTGIIARPGVDLRGNEVLFHPATGMLICGTKIPQWDKVLDMVVEAAKIHPEIGYTGWDFAVSDDKICIIEANEQGNFNLPQTALHKGVYPDYMKIIKLRKKYNKQHN